MSYEKRKETQRKLLDKKMYKRTISKIANNSINKIYKEQIKEKGHGLSEKDVKKLKEIYEYDDI